MPSECSKCRSRRRAERVRANLPRPNGNCAAPDCDAPAAEELWPLCFHHAVPIFLRMKQTEEVVDAMVKRLGTPAEEDHKRITARRDEDLLGDKFGFVYYLRIADHIKIGYTADVRRRMRAYPPSAILLAVEPGSLELESERHRHFSAYRDAGREWFRPSEEMDAHIAALCERHGDPRRYAYRYTTPGEKQPMKVRDWR